MKTSPLYTTNSKNLTKDSKDLKQILSKNIIKSNILRYF
jgi:hypothetical protein